VVTHIVDVGSKFRKMISLLLMISATSKTKCRSVVDWEAAKLKARDSREQYWEWHEIDAAIAIVDAMWRHAETLVR